MSKGILIYKALLLNPAARGSRKVMLTLVKYGKHSQKDHYKLPGKKKAAGSFTVKSVNRRGDRELRDPEGESWLMQERKEKQGV